jgi:hypothetical protein
MVLFAIVFVVVLVMFLLMKRNSDMPLSSKLRPGLSIDQVEEVLTGKLYVTMVHNNMFDMQVFEDDDRDNPTLIAELQFGRESKLSKITFVNGDESMVQRVLRWLGLR